MGYDIVVVGISRGGLTALEVLLRGLPAGFPVPLAIAQHRRTDPDDLLRATLQRHSRLEVREPGDKEPIAAGRAYLAPPDYHLLVERGMFALSTDGPVSHARPSVDVLFESAADAYGPGVVALVMTGSNRDGARGAARVQARGGFLIVQEPASAESAAMPAAALAAARADCVLPLPEIPAFLVGLAAAGSGGSVSG